MSKEVQNNDAKNESLPSPLELMHVAKLLQKKEDEEMDYERALKEWNKVERLLDHKRSIKDWYDKTLYNFGDAPVWPEGEEAISYKDLEQLFKDSYQGESKKMPDFQRAVKSFLFYEATFSPWLKAVFLEKTQISSEPIADIKSTLAPKLKWLIGEHNLKEKDSMVVHLFKIMLYHNARELTGFSEIRPNPASELQVIEGYSPEFWDLKLKMFKDTPITYHRFIELRNPLFIWYNYDRKIVDYFHGASR